MKIFVVGSKGQLGLELGRTLPPSMEMTGMDYPDIDIRDPDSLGAAIDRIKPDWIINAAAYTNVDGAETDEAAAHAVNCTGPGLLAQAAKDTGAGLVHISTDFIFSGEKSRPYLPFDDPDPGSVYGKTKLEGEKAVLDVLGPQALIIRTAWLYSSHGQNFVHTMIRLMEEKEALTVIDDQIGTPCWANGLALAVWTGIEKGLGGIFHWTDAGAASWYDFAVAIQEEAMAHGLVDREIPIRPVPSQSYPTPAKRPAYSVLNKQSAWDVLGLEPVHWRRQLRQMIREL